MSSMFILCCGCGRELRSKLGGKKCWNVGFVNLYNATFLMNACEHISFKRTNSLMPDAKKVHLDCRCSKLDHALCGVFWLTLNDAVLMALDPAALFCWIFWSIDVIYMLKPSSEGRWRPGLISTARWFCEIIQVYLLLYVRLVILILVMETGIARHRKLPLSHKFFRILDFWALKCFWLHRFW